MKESINRYAVYSDLYEIAKLEGKFEQALNYLEQYTEINDSLSIASISIASNESKILEIENRYKHQKLKTENAELRLRQTGYLLACAVCLIVVLIVLWIYFGYRKRTEKKLLLQQADLRDTRNRLLELSIEMERKVRYRTLRKNMLESSPVYKKLHQLAKQKKPQNTRTLISEELWE